MKKNKHIKSFNEHQEKLDISNVSNSYDEELEELNKELNKASLIYSTSNDINIINKANYDMMIISNKIRKLKGN